MNVAEALYKGVIIPVNTGGGDGPVSPAALGVFAVLAWGIAAFGFCMTRLAMEDKGEKPMAVLFGFLTCASAVFAALLTLGALGDVL